MLNYSNRTIVLSPILPSESTIPVKLYLSSLSIEYYGKGKQGYVLLSTNMVEPDQELDEIPVIKE